MSAIKKKKMKQNWPTSGPDTKIAVAHIRPTLDTFIWPTYPLNCKLWARCGPVLLHLFFFSADMRHCYGLIVAQIWQTGADLPSAIIPRSMWARWKCQVWAGSGPQQFWCLGQFCFICFFYGGHAALIWLNCGPNLANRSGPPKCHHSTRHVGQMKTSSVGRIWATAILLSGNHVYLLSYFMYRKMFLIFSCVIAGDVIPWLTDL